MGPKIVDLLTLGVREAHEVHQHNIPNDDHNVVLKLVEKEQI